MFKHKSIPTVKERLLSQFTCEPTMGWPQLNLEGLRLLIHYEKHTRPNKNLDCRILNQYEFESALTEILKKENRPEQGSQRVQFIIRSRDIHFTVVDIEYSKDSTKAIILDAACDMAAFQILSILKDKVNQIALPYLTDENNNLKGIQQDHISCSLFALLHTIAVARLDIHSYLQQKGFIATETSNLMNVTWFDMPPELLIYAQSFDVIEEYIKRLSEQEVAKFNELYQPVLEVRNIDGQMFCVNNSHYVMFEKYSDLMKSFIETLTDDELKDITSSPHDKQLVQHILDNNATL